MRRMFSSHRMRPILSALLALPAAILLVVTTATSASAHVVYQSDEVWANTDSTKCLYTYSEVSHGGRGGYVKMYGLASSDIAAGQACILVWNRNPGQMIAGYQYLKWDGSKWGVCRQLMGDWNGTNWSGIPNTTRTSRLTLDYDFGVVPPCGGGYYGTKAASSVFYGGSWYGGQVPIWSGQHFIEP